MEQAIILLAGSLLLAMVIERLLEILKAIFYVYESRLQKTKSTDAADEEALRVSVENTGNDFQPTRRRDKVLQALTKPMFVPDPNKVKEKKEKEEQDKKEKKDKAGDPAKQEIYWDKLARRLAQFLFSREQGKVGSNMTMSGRGNAFHLDLLAQYVFSDDPQFQGTRVLSADRVRMMFVTYVAKIIGIVLGIALACYGDLNIFVMIHDATPPSQEVPDLFTAPALQGVAGHVVTGIAMGLGSGPMHKFIEALERARSKRKSTGIV